MAPVKVVVWARKLEVTVLRQIPVVVSRNVAAFREVVLTVGNRLVFRHRPRATIANLLLFPDPVRVGRGVVMMVAVTSALVVVLVSRAPMWPCDATIGSLAAC